jgi:MFS family permease
LDARDRRDPRRGAGDRDVLPALLAALAGRQGRDDEARKVLGLLILDKVGRRPLLIVGTIGCVVALTALGVFAYSRLKHDAPGIALISLIVYIASFAVGLGPVFWLMISEIFPLKVRCAAMSVSTMPNWAANFVVSTFFVTLTGAITIEGTFWLYAGFGVAAIIFFVLRLPETKNRSLEEISDEAIW